MKKKGLTLRKFGKEKLCFYTVMTIKDIIL